MDFESPFLVLLPHTLRCSMEFLDISYLSPRIRHFARGALILSIGDWCEKRRSGRRDCLLYLRYHCFQILTTDRTKEYVCIPSHLCDYICKCVFMCVAYTLMYMHIYLRYENLKHRNEKQKTNMVTEGEREQKRDKLGVWI